MKNHDDEIISIQKQVEKLKTEMEKESQEFIRATVEFTSLDFVSRVETAVKNSPEATKAKGLEGLRHLKSELNEIKAKVPELVNKHLDAKKNWLHRQSISNKDKINAYDEVKIWNDNLSASVRELTGYVGLLLKKHNMIKANGADDWTSDNPPTYKYFYEWSETMKNSNANYKKAAEGFCALLNKLNLAKREKEEAEAKSLWDQA